MEFKNVLVTGAAGFIGYHLSKRLLENGFSVTGIDNLNSYYDVSLKTARLEELKPFKNFSFLKEDISNKDAMEKIFGSTRFDVVVNLAAQAGVRYSLENPNAYIDANIVGFINLLECCKHYDDFVHGHRSDDSVITIRIHLRYMEYQSGNMIGWQSLKVK